MNNPVNNNKENNFNPKNFVDNFSNYINDIKTNKLSFLNNGKNNRIITIISFIIFVILFSIVLYYDPYKIKDTNYLYFFIIFIIVVSCILILLITFFSFVSYDETIGQYIDKDKQIISLFNVIFYPFIILFSFIFVIVVVFLLYKYNFDVSLYFPNMSSYYSITYIIWFLLISLLLFFLFKSNSSELKNYYKNYVENFLNNTNNQSVFINIIVFIKNMFLVSYYSFKNLFNDKNSKENKKYLTYLIIIVFVYLFYFFINTFINSYLIYNTNAKYLLRDKYIINKQSVLASYQTLNDIKTNDTTVNNFNYQYSISFWFFVGSNSPETNISYNKFVPILDYGYKPCVMYNVKEGTMRVVVKQKNIDLVSENKNNTNNDIDKTIYSDSNVKMQTWNNVIINYIGGTMDIFLNGDLVSSTPNVVNYMNYDNLTVGSDDGIRGKIKDVIYFQKPLNGTFIYYLYNLQKNTFDFTSFKIKED
jgi:hypothetical protein